MANPVQALNENFFYNSMLARALVQLLNAEERNIMRAWLDKLHEIDGDPEEMNVRNDYMWFLLLVLQNKRVAVPFNNLPPLGPLKPLKEVLPPRLYEDVLTASDQNMSWLDQVETEEEKAQKSDLVSSPPSQFLNNQPVPKEGYMCYLAAFSDQES